MIITIDGPSGTGKSTVSKLLADKLEFEHLDTGAFYRAFALHAMHSGIFDLQEQNIAELLATFQLDILVDHDQKKYLLNKQDVTCEIRLPKVSEYSSKISVFPRVRKAIVSLQREYASQKNIVAEGRDLGSVVFPKAQIKFFLTADKEIRAKRRYDEIIKKNPEFASDAFLEKTLSEIIERDDRDSTRKTSPLTCPEGAILIDTSEMSIDQVVSIMYAIVNFRMHRKKKIRHIFKQMFYFFVTRSFRLLFSLFYRLKVYGEKNIGPMGGIIASNHVSFLDPPILAATAKINVHFLARETLFRVPILKNLIRLLNAHPLKGGIGDLGVIKTVQRLILMQQKIIMFPEGSRSKDGELKPFKKGLANIVIRTGSTVYPVYIAGAYEIWKRTDLLPRLFGKVQVVYGKPIPASRYALLDKKEAQEALTLDLEKSLRDLKKWIEAGATGPIP